MPFQTKAFIEASKLLDMNDKETRLTCTVVNEAEQDELIRNITDKIYQKITMNITDIDFGSIPDSEGDITKIQNYELLVDALQDLEDLYTRYRQDLTQINVVKDAIENVKANKGLFIKAFAARADMPMMTYNTVVLSIVASVSFLISAIFISSGFIFSAFTSSVFTSSALTSGATSSVGCISALTGSTGLVSVGCSVVCLLSL